MSRDKAKCLRNSYWNPCETTKEGALSFMSPLDIPNLPGKSNFGLSRPLARPHVDSFRNTAKEHLSLLFINAILLTSTISPSRITNSLLATDSKSRYRLRRAWMPTPFFRRIGGSGRWDESFAIMDVYKASSVVYLALQLDSSCLNYDLCHYQRSHTFSQEFELFKWVPFLLYFVRATYFGLVGFCFDTG